MSLQSYLTKKFLNWQPLPPEVLDRSKSTVTLDLKQDTFGFLNQELLYRVQRREKIPPWVFVYSGGKTTRVIDNLAPCSPHKFRLQVILRATAVPRLSEMAIDFYGDEKTVFEKFQYNSAKENQDSNLEIKNKRNISVQDSFGDSELKTKFNVNNPVTVDGRGDASSDMKNSSESSRTAETKWLESQWSEETWTSTDSDGTSASCFCMAVRGGYLKQMQIMLEERPALICMINSTNGFTPLATAIRKGDINTVRFLLASGADVDQRSMTAQTPLHLAVLAGNMTVTELLLEKGADFQARDLNDLRVEHYAVDSGSLGVLQLILDRGGDVQVMDSNGWTPLFRAVCQGADTDVIEELVLRGSDVDITDFSGLALVSCAHLLKNRHGRSRDSILRLVDTQYPHEKAVANFTRLTKKISRVHTVFKA